MRLVRNAFVYFLIVFAAGCVLCPIRIHFIAPQFGNLTAVSIEATIVILISWIAARLVFNGGSEASGLGVAGLIALAFLFAGQYAAEVVLVGITPEAFVAGFFKPEGFITLDAFLAYGLMPILAARWTPR